MRRLLIQPQARVDLLEIWFYIAKNSRDAANRVSDKIDAEIRELLEMPGKGHTRADVKNPHYRFWSVYSYVIAYRYDEKTLTVIRVVHGRRDFRRLFRR
jgi:plasmid stabilization system protein ParE